MRLFSGWGMRKLAIGALAFSAAVYAANYILPLGWLIVPAVLLAVAAAALAALRERWVRGAVIAMLSFSLGLLSFYVHYELTAKRAQTLAGEQREVRVRLTGYPVSYGDYCRAEGRVISDGLPRLRAIVYDNDGSIGGAAPGQILTFAASFNTADKLYGQPYDYYHSKGVYLKLSSRGEIQVEDGGFAPGSLPVRLSHYLSGRVDSVFPRDTACFMKSLMLGDKSGLYDDEALYNDLSRAGFMHIVAVSGMHIAFLVGLIRLLLGATRRSSVICIALVWGFTLITGASPSTVRAAIMQSMLLMSSFFQRENDPVTTLSAALALILLQNPFAAASVSLQLSFGAMAGIMLCASPVYSALSGCLPERLRGGAVRYILSTLASSVAVMVFVLPLTAAHFGSVPLLSAVTNIAGLWAVSLCFCGGWISCLLSLIPALGAAAAWLCSWLARYIFLVARLVSDVPFAALYTQTEGSWLWIGCTYLFFAAALKLKWKAVCRLALPALLSAALLAAVLLRSDREYTLGRPTVGVVDVGQGQCVAAISGEDTVVVDCGNSLSAENAGELAGAYLKSCGRDRVDLLVLSHLHADHANGAVMLMEIMPVDTLILPRSDGGDAELRDSIVRCAALHGTELVELTDDARVHCGDIELDILVPVGAGGENEDCLVTVLSIGEYDVLLSSDSSAQIERELIKKRELGNTELLIVGHHGSKYSSCGELLRAIGGGDAVISTGYNNYGHPAEETLERLAECGYNVYRTDQDGTVEIRIG